MNSSRDQLLWCECGKSWRRADTTRWQGPSDDLSLSGEPGLILFMNAHELISCVSCSLTSRWLEGEVLSHIRCVRYFKHVGHEEVICWISSQNIVNYRLTLALHIIFTFSVSCKWMSTVLWGAPSMTWCNSRNNLMPRAQFILWNSYFYSDMRKSKCMEIEMQQSKSWEKWRWRCSVQLYVSLWGEMGPGEKGFASHCKYHGIVHYSFFLLPMWSITVSMLLPNPQGTLGRTAVPTTRLLNGPLVSVLKDKCVGSEVFTCVVLEEWRVDEGWLEADTTPRRPQNNSVSRSMGFVENITYKMPQLSTAFSFYNILFSFITKCE